MRYLKFSDLRERGIVPNRTTLARWQRNLGFPIGFLIGPNSRVFPEREVLAWLAKRARAK